MLEQATGKRRYTVVTDRIGQDVGLSVAFVAYPKTEYDSVQVLILVPSRELALQIDRVFKAWKTSWKAVCCYGGHPGQERKALQEIVLPSSSLVLRDVSPTICPKEILIPKQSKL